MERSQIQYGTSEIAYTIQRGRRHKTVAIGVDPIEGVRVRAPKATSVEKLDEIVHRKAKWILDRRRRQEDLPPPPSPREYVSGETFLYLGRQYRLKLERGRANQKRGVRLVRGHLRVPTHGGARQASEVRDQLINWYRAHANERLPERVALWAQKLDFSPTAVLIRDQRKRWGSADGKGNIRLNWRVVQAPIRLVDYVVVHELTHLQYPDHTREFWASVGSAMNDYEDRQEALRQLGRAMIW